MIYIYILYIHKTLETKRKHNDIDLSLMRAIERSQKQFLDCVNCCTYVFSDCFDSLGHTAYSH